MFLKKLLNSKSLNEQEINLISYLMSMSFDNFYIKDISIENSNNIDLIKYEYYLISKWKELSVDKILVKNSSLKNDFVDFALEEFIIEKIVLDKNEIVAFLNSDFNSRLAYANNEFPFLLNAIKSINNFEITNFTSIVAGEKFFDVENIALKNLNF